MTTMELTYRVKEAGSGGVSYGVALDHESAELVTGQTIHPGIFDMFPTGNLIHVVVEKNPEEYGAIKLPDTIHKEPAGVGYVIAAGPYAGNQMYAQMGGVSAIGVICESPSDLLGLHCMFGQHVGVPIRLSMLERKYNGQVFIMTSRDLMLIDTNPKSLVQRVQDDIGKDSVIVSA